MTVPVIIDLPYGASLEAGDPAWPELVSVRWNRSVDDGYVEWTQTICRHSDGRLLVYVVVLPPSGILRTSGEILNGDEALLDVVERLAQKYDVPSNVPYACIQRYKRAVAKN